MDRDNRPRRIWDEGIDMAYDLIQRHPELLADCPPLSDILFVLDTVNEPQSKGRAVMAKVSKITTKLTDFLDAGDKTWMLEWFSQNNGYMTLNQQYILLLQQLLLFEPVGEDGDHRIGGWDIQELEIIADRLGLKWHSDKRGEAPDIMADDFQWGRVGQSRINFIKARAEEQRRKREGEPPKPKLEQSKLDLTPKAPESKPDLVKTAAELVNTFGLEGAKAVVAAVREHQAEQADGAKGPGTPTGEAGTGTDGWEPAQPLATKEQVEILRPTITNDKVIDLASRRTGTDGAES
jgi:hypothetical protein